MERRQRRGRLHVAALLVAWLPVAVTAAPLIHSDERADAALVAFVLLLAGAFAWAAWTRRREARARLALERELERRTHELDAVQSRRRELESAVDRLRRSESIGRLTSGVAHDHNNLMTIVRQCCDLLLLRAGVAGDPQARALVAESAQAAAAAGDLSRQLLDFARQGPSVARPLALEAHCAEIRPLLERACGAERSFAMHVSAGEEASALRANVDPTLVTSTLINLVANARDATTPGGRIELAVRRLALGEDEAARHGVAAGRYAAIEVRDDGTGMPPEIARQVTEPFFTTKDDAGGTGLGLSIAHDFAVQSRGTLRIESTSGRGTVVTLLLPESADGR